MITPFLDLPDSDTYILRDARVPACLVQARGTEDLVRVDLLVQGGRLAALGAGLERPGVPAVELDGALVWPTFQDIHTHLDKGQIWQRAPNPDGTFAQALTATATDREAHWTRDDIAVRMEFALRSAYAHGTSAIRTHLDSFAPHLDIVWALFRELQARWRGRIDLQAASLCLLGQLAGDVGRAIARQVAATEGGMLGGLVVHEPGLADALDRLFGLASEHGLDLDLHVDENGVETGTGLEQVARAALRHRYRGRVLCGHCCSLAVQPEPRRRETIALVAEAGLGIVSLPLCNLYLQDRQPGATPRWRGITLLHELAAAGVPVMLASDNTRDPFFAYGDLDMLEVFSQSVRIGHLDHPFLDWPRAITTRPAEWMGRPAPLAIGGPADLVVFDARSLNELLSRPQADRLVIRSGRPTATTPPRYRELDGLFHSGC
ncbi:cytosine deaminase [Lichenicoccus sp.]|uniref:cytosine deaminase n=1 Tax=Lichenicoccus sp. TaxID=2781899 RepID=UPI003D13BE96